MEIYVIQEMLINVYSVDWLNALVKKIEKKIERIDHEAAFAIRFGRPGALIMSFIGIFHTRLNSERSYMESMGWSKGEDTSKLL